MNPLERLITAMHAAGGIAARQCTEWLSLAQADAQLGAAIRAQFGKRLPVPARLGQWLTEHAGAEAGALRLECRNSARKGVWLYRVWTEEDRAEHVRAAEAKKQARIEAIQKEAQRIEDARLARLLARRMAAEKAEPRTPSLSIKTLADEILTQTRVDQTTGRITEEPVRGRDGEPLKAHPSTNEEGELPPPPGINDRRPPWLQRGELQARDRDEYDYWQAQRTAPTSFNATAAESGFFDPGGVVSSNALKEDNAAGRYCRVAGRWPR